MNNRSINMTLWGMALGLTLVGMSPQVFAASDEASNTGTTEISATLKAVCTLEAPDTVDFGDIPITALENESQGYVLDDLGKDLEIEPSCSGTEKYTLSFVSPEVSDNCMTAHHEKSSAAAGLGFCLFDPDSNLIKMADNPTYTGTTAAGNSIFTVKPARGPGTLTAGTHTATLEVKISPN